MLPSPSVATFAPTTLDIPADGWAVAESKDGMWFGNSFCLFFQNGNGIHRYKFNGSDYLRPYDGFWHITSILPDDPSGGIWVLADRGSIFHFQDWQSDSFTNVETFDLGGVNLRGICRSPSGVWLCADALYRLDEEKRIWQPFLPGFNDCLGLFADRSGAIWVGSVRHGIACFKDGTFKTYSAAEGFSGREAAVVHEDENGSLWILSDQGVTRFKNGHFNTLTTDQGLRDNRIVSMLEDRQGNYWFNSYRGVFRASVHDLNAVADGQMKNFPTIRYGMADGALGVEGNATSTPNACRSKDGRLWFPTTGGFTVIDPAKLIKEDMPPNVLIETVTCGAKLVQRNRGTQSVIVPPVKGRHLVFRFTAVDLAAENGVEFKYRLRGHDTDWVLGGAERIAVYSGIEPGEYEFQVAAADHRGVWNEEGDRVRIILRPFFYERLAFRVGCAAFGIIILCGIVMYRFSTQRRILTLEKETHILQERERIAQDLHDDVGADLTRIVLLTESLKAQTQLETPVANTLTNIAERGRNLIRGLGELTWAANPRYDSVESLIGYLRQYAFEFFEGSNVTATFDCHSSDPNGYVSPEIRRNVLLAFKESLTNVAKHAGASQLQIELRATSKEIEITVQDNGEGTDDEPHRRQGNGLANMYRRMDAIGGACEFRKNAVGTLVKLSAPLNPGVDPGSV
jgi:signal transduction histidine kinase